MIKVGFLVICSAISFAATANIPPYITACAKTDPNFNECALKSAKVAISSIVKGDKKYSIPNLSPLVLPLVDLQAGSNFNLKFKNLKIQGLEKSDVDIVNIDLKKHEAYVQLSGSSLHLTGPYVIKGKILVLPIEGEGEADMEYADYALNCNVQWEIIKKNGVDFAKVKSTKGGYTTKQVKFQFENLFNGDKKLGTELNKIMNDNWNVVNEDLRAPLSEVVNQVCSTIITGYFNVVPYDELFV